LIGLAFIVINISYHNKSDFILENGAKYLKINDQYLELAANKPHLQLDFTFFDWWEIHEIESNTIEQPKNLNIEIFAQGHKGHATFAANGFDPSFWRKIAAVCGKDACLYIKMSSPDNHKYFAAIKSKIDAPNYVTELMNSNFFGNSTFSINSAQFHINDQKTYRLSTFSSQELIIPHFLFNEELTQGQKVFLDAGTLTNDSIYALVKTESGTVYNHMFEDVLSFNLSKLLEHHVESSTIYLCIGNPNLPNRRLSILNISNNNVLHAVQSDLLLKTTGIHLDKISTPYIIYKNEDLNFVWGDMQFAFTKNKSGDYFAKKRIGRSQWNSARLNKPNLVIGKSLFMDSLSFDFSIASHDIDTVNKVLLRDVSTVDASDKFNNMIPDSLTSLPDDAQDSTIRLDSITNDHIGQAIISLEIEVFDDSPKTKQRKFQFHWGNIDTTLIQEKKNGDFRQSIEISLAKFQATFEKEPILTSSKSGVVDSFDCKISHFRKNKLINKSIVTCNIKDAKTFSNSIKKLESLIAAQAGDRILLSSFSSPQIKDNETLRMEILLKKNSIEDEALSVDDKNLFLQWGELKLKATPLGDSSPKKRTQDQVIEKDKLEQIIRKESFLNKYGRKERIIDAEWFLNDDIFKPDDCKTEKWRECFIEQINQSMPGDFVSLFMRTSSGAGVICQFYVDHVSSDVLIGYGNTQFDSLLFKYSKYVVSKKSLPMYKYEFSWGESVVPLELVGNPRVYGGKISIKKEDLENVLREKIDINSSDGEVICIDHAYLILYKAVLENTPKKFYNYDFDCDSKDCVIAEQELLQVLDDLEGSVYSLRVFVDQHVPTEEGIKVSFIDFIIQDDSNAWIPQKWTSSKYPTELFEFQFVYQNKEKTLIKFDQENEKYKWIFEKYKNDTSVELLDMPGFQTTQRAIYTKYDYGQDANIRNTQVLSKNYTNVFTLYEYYDLASKKINLYWKGYPSLSGAQSYCKDDFVCADGGLELTVDSKKLNIMRGDLVILPENSTGYKFVFDDIDSQEIIDVLEDLPTYTSLLFENILVEGPEGKPLRLPIKFSFHIE